MRIDRSAVLVVNGENIPVELESMEISVFEPNRYILRGLPDPFRFERLKDFCSVPKIKNVVFNGPATVVIWKDGTKTIVKCQDGDTYSKELGLAMCIAKKALGNKGNYYDVFKQYLGSEEAS